MRDFNQPSIDLTGASILVTGGTGSFGKRFIAAVLERHRPRRLIIFSRDELKQYDMALQHSPETHACLRYFIGDVRDRDRLTMAMRDVDYVVHAAALKQVPAAEYNPFECIRTNVIGAENVVYAAIATGVKRVVALSTDKAANPINLYGASKLAADKIFVAANNLSGALGTRFSVVRYGNVMNSRGSIIEMAHRLVARGARSIPVTDPRMSRFWITLEQGVNLVLSSFAIMSGGEIFVPKIPSMRIVDMMRCIAPGLEHEIVGIRPGEKLDEILVTADDARHTLELGDRYVIEPMLGFWSGDAYRRLGARAVGDDFVYSSDRNDEWLSPDNLRIMMMAA